MNQITVIGVGLIGGSLALDAKRLWPTVHITGIDQNAEHLKLAQQNNIIDDMASDYSVLQSADLVILSIPVNAMVHELPKILDHVGENTLVIDAGSTKLQICESVSKHKNRRNYLACHPIAGTEFSGPLAATANLYENKTNIICEVEQTAFKLQEKALDFFSSIGMRIRYMNPSAHDKHIAYMSHLSHISSFMLGKTVLDKEEEERDIFDMAGSGFESTVRLAKSSSAMWTPIFEQNKEHVLESLKSYIQNLTEFYSLLEQNQFSKVKQQMDDTNKIKDILNGMPQPSVPKNSKQETS